MISRLSMRRLIFNIHLYAALVFGAALVVMGFTGGILAFEGDILRALHPQLFKTAGLGQPLPVDQIDNRFSQRHPNVRWDSIRLAGAPGSLHILQAGKTQYVVNPYTGEIAGSLVRPPVFETLQRLHMSLALGPVGAAINRAGSAVLLFLAISGIYLWWPLKRWKVSVKSSLRRVSFDTHLAGGFYTSLFIGALAATGLLLSSGFAIGTALFGDSDPAYKPPKRDVPSVLTPGAAQISPDGAIRAAQEALPTGVPFVLVRPKNPTSSYTVVMRLPGDLSTMGRSWVNVDQYSAKAVNVVSWRQVPAASRAKDLVRAIHTGDIFGYPSKFAMSFASFFVVIQSLTGVYLWWKKRGVSARRTTSEAGIPVGVAE